MDGMEAGSGKVDACGPGETAEVVSTADASLAGLEESPGFTLRARLLQWGAPHSHAEPDSPASSRCP